MEEVQRWAERLLVEEDDAVEAVRESALPSSSAVEALCRKALEVLNAKTSSFVEVSCPITVVGDIHGQLFDFLEMFRVAGPPDQTNYLFLGDYVDRGHFSVETILLLLFLKVKFPSNVTLLRGNHETRQITQVYGFYDECLRKYSSPQVWKDITEVFDVLPVAALISSKNLRVLAVHAGLSPSLETLDDIKALKINSEIPHEGAVCDLLWSDPAEDSSGWGISQRGAGYVFGSDIVAKFNQRNNLDLICRSHQLVMEGYKEIFDKKLVTVWSAPNYCYRCGNQAAILQIDDAGRKKYDKFVQAPGNARYSPPQVSVDYFL